MVYKQGQGMTSRLGAVGLSALLGGYAGWSWYQWLLDPDAVTLADSLLSIGFLGSLVVLLGVALGGSYLALVSPSSSDYLIDMDTELRKVVWPSVQPLFDPKAEAWGSTYVVIACTVVLTIFIWIVDGILQGVTTWMYGILF